MLSINIPVYNYKIRTLVAELILQAKEIEISFEIRVYDDGSKDDIKKSNRKILESENVVYLELEKNLGRAAIRNKMGFESEYEYLLFIDADSIPVDRNYLRNYIQNIKPHRVLCGGTAYKHAPPADHEKFLRWFYGIYREAIPADTRNNKKGFIITSNNFLIDKETFKKVHFREDIKKYGHEDTLLGYDLFNAGIEIFHIDNPLEHIGLESAQVFIYKTKTALNSLFDIENHLLKNRKDFIHQVYFLNRYYALTKWLPKFILRLFYKVSRNFIERDLKGEQPSLLLFDLYKLGYYSTLR